MGLIGYDWAPHGVELDTSGHPERQVHARDPRDYVWQQGASHIAECLVTGKEPLITAEHALHVVEIIIAARTSQDTGRRIDLVSRFKWPVIT
jgi:predicted dehydrogenase